MLVTRTEGETAVTGPWQLLSGVACTRSSRGQGLTHFERGEGEGAGKHWRVAARVTGWLCEKVA
jgi:hypothetical protein